MSPAAAGRGRRGQETGLGDRQGARAAGGGRDRLALRAARGARRAGEPGPGAAAADRHPQRRRPAGRGDRRRRHRRREIADPRRFDAPLDPQSVHQGAALEVEPLDWGSVSEVCAPRGEAPTVLLLDRVTDPHNVGAILRSAEVFGARAVIAPHRHSAPETGALAKAASGALERQPYLRVPNLANAMGSAARHGLRRSSGSTARPMRPLAAVLPASRGRPLALALGAEGPGLRELTGKLCDRLARIPAAGDFGSLNVSNAAAVALYAASEVRAR